MLNKTEEFFKDKIDWKFINYLIDRTTKYEDLGYYVDINVVVRLSGDINNYSDYYAIYQINDKYYPLISDSFYYNIINYYNKYGIFYEISIYRDSDITDISVMTNFRNDIKHRCSYINNSDITNTRGWLSCKPL